MDCDISLFATMVGSRSGRGGVGKLLLLVLILASTLKAHSYYIPAKKVVISYIIKRSVHDRKQYHFIVLTRLKRLSVIDRDNMLLMRVLIIL